MRNARRAKRQQCMKKTCSHCGRAKPIEDFTGRKNTVNAQLKQCRNCRRVAQRWRRAHPDAWRVIKQRSREKRRDNAAMQKSPPIIRDITLTHRICKTCQIEKSLRDYYAHAGAFQGRRSRCIACMTFAERRKYAARHQREQ